MDNNNQLEDIESRCYPASDIYVLMHFWGEALEGEFRHLYAEESETFNSVSQFIYKLELMLEQSVLELLMILENILKQKTMSET